MEHRSKIIPDAEAMEPDISPGDGVRTLVRETRKLLREGDRTAALDFFNRMHPVDQGEVLVGLAGGPQRELLSTLAPTETAAIVEHLEPKDLARLCESLEPLVLSQILDETSPDVAADILNDLPHERFSLILGGMKAAEEVLPLLRHPDDTAGGLMTTALPVVPDYMTTAIALDRLRLLGRDAEEISAVFVVADEGKLLGTLSVTRLALSRPTTVVGDITNREFTSVRPETDQEESARLMERYNLNQLPVVDRDGRLMGVILAEDMVDVVEEEATEDMYRMAGIGGERVFGPLSHSLRRRLPWLYINLATAFLAAVVISLFESTIVRVVALAAFLPVVAGQGGVGGTQTVTLVVRSMALGELASRSGIRLLLRELALGLANGVLLGVVVGVVAFAWKGNYMLGLVLGLAMLGNMLVAALAGAGVPLLLRRLKMDPAVSSAVFVTTFTDVIGFVLFLGLAAAFVNLLL
jgi:magnesium transporter